MNLSLYKNLKTPSIIIILLILFVPDDIFILSSILDFKTPNVIRYKWLDTSFSFIFIPFIFLILKKKINGTHMLLFIFWFTLLLWNLIKSLFYKSYLISNLNFELFYATLIAIVIIIFVESKLKTFQSLQIFFEIFMISQIIGLFLGIILDAGFDGRFHPPNLDVGTTGLFLGIYFVFHLFVKEKQNIYWLLIIFISILLTGSRANVILPLIFLIFYFFKKVKYIFSIKFFVFIVFCFPLIYFIDFSFFSDNLDIIRFFNFDRISNLIDISKDESFLGRLKSLEVGIEVLYQYPLGIFFSFIDLQWVMQMNGYPTFPHSTILAFYLVLGPFSLIIIYFLLKLLFSLFKEKNNYFFLIFYLMIASIFFGGMFVNFKIFFFYLLVFKISKNSLNPIKPY